MAIFTALGCFYTWKSIERKFNHGGPLWRDFLHFFDNFMSHESAMHIADFFVNDISMSICVIMVGLILMPIDLFFLRER